MKKITLSWVLGVIPALIWLWSRTATDSGITAQDIDLGRVQLHVALWVDVPVVSESSVPIRVLGVTSSCSSAGCVLESELPDTIEPFGKAVIKVQFRPEQIGWFERRVEFYTDGTLHYRNAFTIRGTGLTSVENQATQE